MLKKLLGIVIALIGLPIVGFAIYLFVTKSLHIITQFNQETIGILPLGLGLLKWLIATGFICFIGIVCIRGGTFLFNYKNFSPNDVGRQFLHKIYKKEKLDQQTYPAPTDPKYEQTKDIDLADIYQQIDRVKFPDTYQDLMNTIKSRVEKA